MTARKVALCTPKRPFEGGPGPAPKTGRAASKGHFLRGWATCGGLNGLNASKRKFSQSSERQPA